MESHIQVSKPKSMAFVLMAAAFIGLFGETALNMALTNIMEDFSITAPLAQWLTTGYLLTMGILVPISALLIKWFSTRKLVIAGLVLSSLGTVVAAMSTNFVLLLIGRVTQALGTGIVLPLMLNVILLIFPISKRGLVMGMMGLVITTAPAIGPTLAGVIVTNLDWSYIFWLSLALYIILIVFGLSKIEDVSHVTKPKIDFLSILLSSLGFGGLIYSFSTMAEKPLTSMNVYIPLLIGMIALFLFIIRQIRMDEPMMNLQVFKYPMFTIGTILLFIGMVIILSSNILLPLYLKGSLLFTAAMAGIILLPGNISNAIMAPIVGALFDKVEPKKLLVTGFTFVSLANFIFALTISSSTPVWQIIIAYMILFIGIALLMMPAQTNGLNQLPRELYADGTAVMNTLQQIGGAGGTSIAITLMMSGQNRFTTKFPGSEMTEILAAGTKFTFIFITIAALLGLILTLFIQKPNHSER